VRIWEVFKDVASKARRTASAVAGVAVMVAACAGCGGGGGMTKELVNFPPIVESLEVSKKDIIIGERTTITAKANDPNGDSVRYEWITDPGGTLIKVEDSKYIFTTAMSGEFKVRVRVNDGKDNLWTDAETKIRCLGPTAEYGGVTGKLILNLSKTAGRVSETGEYAYEAIDSPVALMEEPERDFSRRTMYRGKNFRTTSCEAEEFRPGELMVGLRQGVSVSVFAASRGLGVKKKREFGFSLLTIDIEGAEEEEALDITRRACVDLKSDPDVETADLNAIGKLFRAPNDPMYYNQWHYDLINLPRAWDITTGSDNVIVAVLDSGIVSKHEDMRGRLVAGYDFISDPYSGCDGDGMDPDPEDFADSRCFYGPIDSNSSFHLGHHGTHTAGTIGAASNNSKGVAGATWAGKIMPVRVAGTRGIDADDLIQAMYYAVGLPNDSGTVPSKPARVLNLSLGYPPAAGCPAKFYEVFRQVHDAGAIVFVSSGNSYSSTGINSLALCDYAIGVGAVDRHGVVTGYSNKGPGLGLTAPGGYVYYEKAHGVLSPVRSDAADNDSGYDYYQGTSMSAPHASGVAALMIAAYPSITPDEIAEAMSQTATDLGEPGTDTVYGAGLLNAYAAVREAKKMGGSFADPSKPEISASPTDAIFHPTIGSRTVIITNTGSGNLTINSVRVTTELYPNWLKAVLSAPAANSVTLRIEVDRTGLPAGTYNGRVLIFSNGGEKVISVRMEVPDSSVAALENCEYYNYLYIALLDRFDDLVDYRSIPFPGGDYSFFNIPDGRYYFLAATDCDGDGIMCEQYDDMCGGFESFHDPTLLTVKGGEVVENVDITLHRFYLLRGKSFKIAK
jgi:serine protease